MILEDETGRINVIVSSNAGLSTAASPETPVPLIIRGRDERARGVTNLVADHIERLPLAANTSSRDFR